MLQNGVIRNEFEKKKSKKGGGNSIISSNGSILATIFYVIFNLLLGLQARQLTVFIAIGFPLGGRWSIKNHYLFRMIRMNFVKRNLIRSN